MVARTACGFLRANASASAASISAASQSESSPMPLPRRIEHLFDTLEACPHLTNFFASPWCSLVFTAVRIPLRVRIPGHRRTAADSSPVTHKQVLRTAGTGWDDTHAEEHILSICLALRRSPGRSTVRY